MCESVFGWWSNFFFDIGVTEWKISAYHGLWFGVWIRIGTSARKNGKKNVSLVGYSMCYISFTEGNIKTNDYCLLRCDAMWTHTVLPVCQRNLLRPIHSVHSGPWSLSSLSHISIPLFPHVYLTFLPWRWRQPAPQKHWSADCIHDNPHDSTLQSNCCEDLRFHIEIGFIWKRNMLLFSQDICI